MEKVVALIGARPDLRNIVVTLMVDDDIPQVVFDPGQLQQALLNLIINAKDATEGSGEITVFAQRAFGQGKVVVNIIDQGCGISAEEIDSIFDAFCSTNGEEGSRVGLSTVRELVENNGGIISVTGNVGCGSCFRIVLPAVQDKKLL